MTVAQEHEARLAFDDLAGCEFHRLEESVAAGRLETRSSELTRHILGGPPMAVAAGVTALQFVVGQEGDVRPPSFAVGCNGATAAAVEKRRGKQNDQKSDPSSALHGVSSSGKRETVWSIALKFVCPTILLSDTRMSVASHNHLALTRGNTSETSSNDPHGLINVGESLPQDHSALALDCLSGCRCRELLRIGPGQPHHLVPLLGQHRQLATSAQIRCCSLEGRDLGQEKQEVSL